MPAVEEKIEVERGATFRKKFTLYNDEALTSPMNLTGYSAAMQVRTREDGEIFLDLTTGNGITLGGPLGTVELLISATDTSNLPIGLLSRYQIELTAPNGDVDRMAQGFFETDQEITK